MTPLSSLEKGQPLKPFLTFQSIMINVGNITFMGTGNRGQCELELKELFDEIKCKSVFKSNCFDKADDPEERPKAFYAFSTYWYLANYLQ